MRRYVEIAVWVVAWVVGVFAIATVSSILVPSPMDLVVDMVGGFAWGWFMGNMLTTKILNW